MNGSKPATRAAAPARRGAAGFTLIELMVVVAVLAILAAIALPSYQDSVRKGRRGQAKADLAQVAQLAERYRTVNGTFTGFASPIEASPQTGDAYYDIEVDVEEDGTTFIATATPVAGSDQANDTCGALALNAAGTKWHEKGDDRCEFGTVGPP
ncbi:prepilin-type N-terminal cleavage/methylation domain-containing protein [Luteimonas sp. Y-2-2-4F]|nr:prepilin-type N-terminal cleavage/methylation domain-containing protein [Luteimonas sp. Y-2-2-4F]